MEGTFFQQAGVRPHMTNVLALLNENFLDKVIYN
jgi:hypothetical protein